MNYEAKVYYNAKSNKFVLVYNSDYRWYPYILYDYYFFIGDL